MKHKLLYLVATLLAVSPAWAQDDAGAGEETIVPSLTLVPKTANQMTIEQLEDGSFHILTSGGDPYVSSTELQRDLTDEETIACIEYYSPTGMGNCEFFFNQGKGFVGGREQGFTMNAASDWTTCYVDIADSKTKFSWGKQGDFVRFDTGTASGLELFVRKITFITEEAYDELMKQDAGEISLTKDAEGYYLINTPADLQELARVVNCGGDYSYSNARLTADLDMAEVTDYCPIGVGESSEGFSTGATMKKKHYFAGIFDGQNHVIKNLTAVNNKSYGQSGIFGIITGTVKNLGVDNYTQDFGGAGYSGRHAALGGQLCEGLVENCYVINSTVTHSGEIVAALLAGNYGGTVRGCWEYGNTIEGYSRAGRLIGDARDDNSVRTGTEINCVSEGNVTGTYLSKVESCYSNVEAAMFADGTVTFRLNGSQSTDVVWYQTIGTDELPTRDNTHGVVYAQGEMNCDGNAKPGGEITYTNSPTAVTIPDHVYELGICVNCGADMPGLMQPGEDGYIEIQWYTQLVKFAQMVNAGNKTLKARLVADIDLSPVENFTPIGLYSDQSAYNVSNFSGVFDGNYHVIKNLNVTVDTPVEAGLFGRINGGGKVMNLGIINANIVNNYTEVSVRAGVLAGEIHACVIDNCWTAGELFVSTSHEQASGLSGEGAASTFNNCWSTYDGALVNAASALNNCYPACADIAATGELCYNLNGKTFLNPTYYQNIGEDAYPVWDSTHARVYQQADESYASLTQDNFGAFRDDIIAAELDWSSLKPYQTEMQEAYEASVNALADLATVDEFFAAYEAMMDDKASVQACMDAYEAYQAKYAEIQAYLEANPDFAGPGRVVLENYLNESIEPGDDFPNGSYKVIMDERSLNTEQMIEETTYMADLLVAAIASDYTPGSEITSLMVNADFSNEKEGWTENSGTFNVYATDAAITHVAGTTSPFDMSQTLTGLKDGIYEITVKANYRPDGDNQSLNYASFVYANEAQTYTKTMIEDYVPYDAEYVDETNFTNVYEDGMEVGWAPILVTGHAKAFAEGLYENRIVAYVTDGQLTLGVRTPGTPTANVTRMADFHLYYQGDIESETATAAIDRTLEGMLKTADNLLNLYIFTNDETYATAPNYPLELKEALLAAVQEATAATTGAQKYALVQKIGDLFNKIYEGKNAYIDLVDMVERLLGEYTGAESGDDAEEVIALADRVWGAYDEDPAYPGISTEEAIALTAQLKERFALYMRLTTGGMHAMEFTNNGAFSYAITTTGGDPYVYTSKLEKDLTADQTILYFQYQSEIDHIAEIFYSPIAAGNEIWFDFYATAEGEWKDMFIPLTDALKSGWGKVGDNLRLDPIPDGETTMSVRKIQIISEAQMEDIKNGGSAIQAIAIENTAQKAQGVYDLTGRKYTQDNKLQKGLYIINGKKYLVK